VSADIDVMMDRLEVLTSDMDVPEFRRRKVPWLRRNLAIRNADHPNFAEAMGLVEELSKMGVH
jgi:hypothetical protein